MTFGFVISGIGCILVGLLLLVVAWTRRAQHLRHDKYEWYARNQVVGLGGLGIGIIVIGVQLLRGWK